MPLPPSNIIPGKINFERLSNYIKNVIDPLSAILEINGIQITEYTFRKVYNQEKLISYDMHIFHLSFDKEMTHEQVKYWFNHEFGSNGAHIQVDFSSIEGQATALMMY